MAVVNVKSTAITNATATPVVLNAANISNGNVRQSLGLAVITNGDSIGSTYRICRIRSSDRISSVSLFGPAIAGAVADIGLYDLSTSGTAGAVVDADSWASAQALTSALNGTDVTYEAGAALGLITNAEKRVWECLGLASDPSKEYEVTLTLTAAATATGTYLVRVSFVSGE